MRRFAFLVIPITVFLSGCSSTGGIVGGLVPAPKILKGKVESSVYHAADGSFVVNTPAPEHSYEYTYMEVKEQYLKTGAYVSFHSSAAPYELYRVEIGKQLDKSKPSLKFEYLVDALLKNYKQQLLAYGSEAIEQRRVETSLDGKRAMFVILKQHMPSKSSYQGTAGGYTAHHIMYILESPNGGGGSVWVQWPHECDACDHGSESDVLLTHEKIKSFIQSFRMKI